MAMDWDFSGLGFKRGEVAVVTGSANGIGKATALMLARAGVTIAAWDIEDKPLKALVGEIEALGTPVHPIIADISEQAAIDDAWRQTLAIGGPVKYLVNNAGPASTTPLSVAEGVRIAVGSYSAVSNGFFASAGAAAASMTFTASVAGNSVAGGTTDWYPAAKAGVAGLMRHLAVKMRGKPRSNGVAPGSINTRRTAAAQQMPAMQAAFAASPLGRIGEPEEVAATICFLLSPAASYINGQLIAVDGASHWG
jgi:NAD(P)-dependent dehydrogenase (short-subunit alcohol dehydrogenase family)